MNNLISTTLYLIAIINPVSKIFVLSTLSEKFRSKDIRIVSVQASIIALAILVIFALAGNIILTKIFHVETDGKKYILDYPFEMGVKNLPLGHKLECIQGYLNAWLRGNKNHANLEEWIDNRLGWGMAKHFMIPYNNKIWNCKLSEISTKLVNSRIDPSSAINFIVSALGKKFVGRAYQAKFIYPKEGLQKIIDYIRDIPKKTLISIKQFLFFLKDHVPFFFRQQIGFCPVEGCIYHYQLFIVFQRAFVDIGVSFL